tara:strand:- start:399 stop:860 length:462 start_codon:yes stop_codon:yes gene_type:complete
MYMSFSVFINSEYAVDTTALMAVRNYDIDWSRFEEGDYELSFAFDSIFQDTNDNNINIVPHALSLPDLPLKNVISPQGGRSRNSPSVGIIHTNLWGAQGNNRYYQQHYSNPNNKPVVCNRPSSQDFRVRFLGFEGDEITAFVDYTLMLYFKKL